MSSFFGNKSTADTSQQSSSNFLQNLISQMTGQQTSQSQFGQQSQATEDPSVTAFRNKMMGQYQDLISRAQQPVYGDAQKAQFISGQNQNLKQTGDQLTNQLASRGILNSGATTNALTQLNLGRMGNISNFQAQLPFAEKQAQAGLTQNALQGAGGLVGQTLRGGTTSGQQAGQVDMSQNQTQNTTGSQQGQQTGQTTTRSNPSIFSSILGAASAALGLGSMFGGGGGGGGGWNPGAPGVISPGQPGYNYGPGAFNPFGGG